MARWYDAVIAGLVRNSSTNLTACVENGNGNARCAVFKKRRTIVVHTVHIEVQEDFGDSVIYRLKTSKGIACLACIRAYRYECSNQYADALLAENKTIPLNL